MTELILSYCTRGKDKANDVSELPSGADLQKISAELPGTATL